MSDINNIDTRSSQICVSCGICCMGILFDQDEDPEKYGFAPEPRSPLLPLACRLYRDKDPGCIIYADPNRPLICKAYQCQTLKQLLQDGISLEQAQARAKNIKTLLAKILTHFPQSDTPKPANAHIQSVCDSLKLELDSGDQSHLELYLDILFLRLLISRHIILM